MERLGLRAAVEYSGLAYSTLRQYISDGYLPALRTPNGKLWVDRTDLDALFVRYEVKPKPQPSTGVISYGRR
jgi:predicted site-specific integrase-resolvase